MTWEDAGMGQAPWSGRVEVDIRDSEPDWTPFLQPKAPAGAPNVLVILWDDVGYGAMDVFGGPIETPTMRRIADLGLRYSNFHTTALCSPTRSSLLTGRNATSNNMACITEASAGFPGFSARIPFENGTIAEVLNERGWNTYAIGKWHLTPGRRGRPVGLEGVLAARPGVRAVLWLPGRRDQPVVSRPGLRQPPHRAALLA
jgi:arylsulfatase A-like enzyme